MENELKRHFDFQLNDFLQTQISERFNELEQIINKKILKAKNSLDLDIKRSLHGILPNNTVTHQEIVQAIGKNLKKIEEDIEQNIKQKLELFSQKVEMMIMDIKEIIKEIFLRSELKQNLEDPFTINKLNPISPLKIKPKSLKNCFESLEEQKILVFAEENGIISLWNSLNFKKFFTIKAFNTEISSIKYVKKYQILYSSSRNKIKAYRFTSKKTLVLIKCFELTNTLGFMLPLGNMNKIVTSEGLKTTSIRSLNSFKLKGELSKTGYSAFFIEKYSLIVIDYFDGLIGLCDINKPRELSRVESGHKFSSVLSWAFCPTKNLLFAAMNSGTIRIWNLSFDGFTFYKERTVPKISCLIYNMNHHIIFSSSDRALWNYNIEDLETVPLIFTEFNIKDFKIDFKNKLLFYEQSSSIQILKFR